jgi:hypothetical protein
MPKKMVLWLLMIVTVCLGSAMAQEETKKGQEASNLKADNENKPVHAYRVDFSIYELQNGKRINTRHYSLDLSPGPWSEIKIGSRIPVTSGADQYQYLDLGTNIGCELGEQGDDVSLRVTSDFSSLAGPGEQTSRPLMPPIVRQIKIEGRTVAGPGRPALIGAVDDPNSDRQFQLEATTTRLK